MTTILRAVGAAARGQVLWTDEQVTRLERWWDEVVSSR